MNVRLPSFNDFSPGTIGTDLRRVLEAVSNHPKDDNAIFAELEATVCAGWEKKRLRTNIPATLGSTGLTSGRPLALTDFGQRVKDAPTAREAAEIFCTEIIEKQNGLRLLEAIQNLNGRGDKASKRSLQAELARLGVSGLANDTTDHTTLKNWMIQAGIVVEVRRGYPTVDDAVLKKLTGMSIAEHDELAALSPAQQIFLHLLRKRHVTESGPFKIHDLYTECLATNPHSFGSADLAKAVKDPLSKGGWITVSAAAGGGRGGKSGTVVGTARLLALPLDRIVPNLDATVPPDLYAKLQTPLKQIKDWLNGSDTHKGGLGLELLALRIILDLRLTPREFRLRSKDSAYAEVDVTAEGDHLLFSRWTFQCKRIQKTKNVGLADVAKEVGIAIYMKAHVIVMVSTGGFSSEALNYAREIARATHFQFVFLDKTVVQDYLRDGPSSLHDFVMQNARRVMQEKRSRPWKWCRKRVSSSSVLPLGLLPQIRPAPVPPAV